MTLLQTPAKVCWKIGPYRYREIEVYVASSLSPNILDAASFNISYYQHTTNVVGTSVQGMSPTDFNFTISSRIALANQALPIYQSGSNYKITIWGARFGDSLEESPLVMRPIAMPFAMTNDAVVCVLSDTTEATRAKVCKEFKYTIDDYDGGAKNYCDGGSEIDSAHIEDYYPVAVHKYSEVVGGITREMSYAVFDFTKVLLEHSSRFMVCWRMTHTDHIQFPWATIGNIDARQRNMNVNGIISWDVWVTHTFGMEGAYVESITVEPTIVANRPFKLTMVGLGIGCDPLNPRYSVKLAIGNGVQAVVGGTFGGGCFKGSDSSTEGAVIGGEALIPTCRQDLSSGRRSVVELTFTVLVEADTQLEFCWSSTAGVPQYKNAFYIGGSSYVTLKTKPWYVDQFLVNNQVIQSAANLMAHQPFSLTLIGQGLQKTGTVKLNISIAEDCLDESTIVPGGNWREVDCIFGHHGATVEFNIYRPVSDAQICLIRTISAVVWNPFLARSRYYCTPTYCGAPTCQLNSFYLFDGAECDAACCQDRCLRDPTCNFWQRYEIPGRVFRRCQTMAHCTNPSILMLFDRSPIITQKTFGIGKQTYAAATLPAIGNPVVYEVTPQVNPALRARVPFVINVQGTGFVPGHVQIHVKIANKKIGCNDRDALNKTLTMWNQIVDARTVVFKQLEIAKDFSYNGTCAGANSNCEGGPAPPGKANIYIYVFMCACTCICT